MDNMSLVRAAFVAIASVMAFQLVTSQDDDPGMKEYCEGKNDTIDVAMTIVFSCHINATLPQSLEKNIECYNKVSPQGVPFPNDTMNVDQVKKFACQKDFEAIGKKAEECANQTKTEQDEEEKKVLECLQNYS